jgi:hypothetical protein
VGEGGLMRDYGKVFSQIWESEDFRSLSEDGRALVLYLLTCKHGTIAGVFRLPDGYVCEDIQWTPERVAKGFADVSAKGFATRCECSKWVWVTKFLEWNPPENPNQRKAAAKMAAAVPDQCAWKRDFMRVSGPLLGIEPPANPPPPSNPSGTLGEGLPNQKQKQEQEQEQEKPSASSADKLPPCPGQRIVDLYHEVLPELPAVRLMNDGRRKALAKTWGWVLTTTTPEGARRAETAEEAMGWLRRYFERARENDFLMGRTPRRGEHAGWVCDLDFLLTDRGMKQVIEKTKEAA